MSQPAPKQNFTQTLLLLAVIFLGFQLFVTSRQPSAAAAAFKSPDEVLTQMRKLSGEGKAQEAAGLLSTYNSLVSESAKGQKITDEQAKAKRLEGSVVLADAYLKRAQTTHAVNDAFLAFNQLTNEERKLKNDPIWKQPFTVPPTKEFPGTTVSAEAAYAEITKDLDTRYRKDLVWGFMPGYQLIDSLVALTGRVPAFSYAFAALLLAIVVRAVVWPLSSKQIRFGRQMQQLQPLVRELEEQFKKKDPSGGYKQTPEYQQKVMGLYKEYGINPVAGCFPAFLQMPLFLIVYQCMVHYRFAFENGTFLWINPHTAASTGGFVARSLGHTDLILIIVYAISMVATTLLQPVSDPTQVKQQRMIGISLAVLWPIMMMFYPLPSAFVLYWIFTNVLSVTQTLMAYRTPLPKLEKVNAPGGGLFPTDGNGAVVTGALDGILGKSGGPRAQKPKKKA